MRGSAARSIVGGIVGEECPRCRGSVQAEAAFAVRRHESKSNVITFESEHPFRIYVGSSRLPVVPPPAPPRTLTVDDSARNYSLYLFLELSRISSTIVKGKNNLGERIDNFFDSLTRVSLFNYIQEK